MKRYWLGIYGQVRAYQKRFLRDKMALFFTFLFPLFFLFIFGSIFGNSADVSLRVAIISHSKHDFSKNFVAAMKDDEKSPLKVDTEVTDIDEAKEKMSRSQLDGVIELPESFGEVNDQGFPSGTVNVLHQKGSNQAGQTISAIMSQTIEQANRQIGRSELPLRVSSQEIGEDGLTDFDYTFSGLLAFGIMSMGIFGLANSMPSEKQTGSYRRLRAAPFEASQLIIANAIHYIIITLFSVASMLLVGMTFFDFTMRGSWVILAGFIFISAAMITGFGLLIGSWAKNENQSAPLANLVSFPMMFLSGVFFPSFLFPEWIQAISKFIPLAPVVDGLRLIMAESADLTTLVPQIALIGGWIIVVYVAAIKLFRWG
ncbi:ABC transporter permease [Candidatus Saccharibacteria bacterium]|jgi:ABC-2 type transport system permease protein|nr:ABC transporter permease [Candidatus Saccharibacteria bacterium]